MEQIAKVIAVENGRATLEVERNEACKKCGICHMGRTQRLLLEAENDIGAEPGQRVLVKVAGRNVLKAGAIIYLVPLLVMLVGMAGGWYAAAALDLGGSPDLWAIGAGLVFFALCFVAIRMLEPRWQRDKGFAPVLIRVVEDYEESTDFCGQGDE